jgi:class 3 adenylate cyclase
VAFLLYSREERWLFLLAASIWIGSYIWIQLSFGTPYLTLPEAERFSAIVFTLNAIGSFALLGAVLSLFYGEIRRTETELQRQYRLSEDLLANILPARIAEQLKDGPETVAQGFSNVTLLFADIVGFTRLAEKLSPREVVDLLNQIFSRFDLLTERLGLEKIKTIGDEYMLAGGLPEPRRGHAAAVAEAALQMMEAIETINRKTGRNLDLRIGIHSGEVVAGVIGSRKFSYDVWGDTVNTASRMQSQSVPGRIQVSQAAYERLKHAFEFKPRGSLRVRGKGRMKTWYLEARKVELDEPAVSE